MEYEPLTPDHYYHIYNRGNNSGDLFFKQRNYTYFLLLLKRHLLPVAEIYAYYLLKNHFHLLVKIKESATTQSASKAFSNLFNAYAKAINKSEERTGSLFQDRFKRILIKDEKYLKELNAYIHLNPEHHSFVDDFREYSFSSYDSMVSDRPTFLEKEKTLDFFGNKENFVEVHLMKRISGSDFEMRN